MFLCNAGIVNRTYISHGFWRKKDGDNFRSKFIKFIDRDIVQLQETLSQMETGLSNGLDEAKSRKKFVMILSFFLAARVTGKVRQNRPMTALKML